MLLFDDSFLIIYKFASIIPIFIYCPTSLIYEKYEFVVVVDIVLVLVLVLILKLLLFFNREKTSVIKSSIYLLIYLPITPSNATKKCK